MTQLNNGDTDEIDWTFESLLRWYQSDIFSKKAIELYHLMDKYAAETSRVIAKELDLKKPFESRTGIEQILDDRNIHTAARPLARRLIKNMCLYGMGERYPDETVRLEAKEELFDRTALKEKCLRLEPKMSSAFAMADRLCSKASDFCMGKVEDNAVRSKHHIEFFTQCPLGCQSSELGGKLINNLASQLGRDLEILELGAGTMGGAVGVLDAFKKDGRLASVKKYLFSELNPFFVMNARKILPEKYPEVKTFQFHYIDFNKKFDDEAIPADSIDIVHSVNALHCAKDLSLTLSEIQRVLKPGGFIVIPQYTRFSDDDSLPFVDFICDPLSTYWDVNLNDEMRPAHGLMSAHRWKVNLESVGFGNVHAFPEPEFGLKCFGENYYIAAIIGQKIQS